MNNGYQEEINYIMRNEQTAERAIQLKDDMLQAISYGESINETGKNWHKKRVQALKNVRIKIDKLFVSLTSAYENAHG